jgi:prepilin-type N-terminal cleavage/methylation domain-containing protein
MKRKGFTLVELLVVIAIIALLMGILMPALSKVRQIANRLVCGTNLSGIGKAMMVYANEYEDEFPRAGGRTSVWADKINNWQALNRYEAFCIAANGTGGAATITSSLYLLVKYTEVTPQSFVCKSDSGVSEFNPVDYGVFDRDITQLWDFGPYNTESDNPGSHCSYSYHMPYSLYALTTASDPGLAVAADRNPWIKSPSGAQKIFPDVYIAGGGSEAVKAGNSPAHQGDSQNVLFVDIHVDQEKTPACGVQEDNIYTYWGTSQDPRLGSAPASNTKPSNRLDSYLVNDGLGPKNRACFTGDTPVWVGGTMVEISKVVTGQVVNAFASTSVEKLEEHEGAFECRDIVLENGNCVSVVDAHRFMLENGNWAAAQNLRSGFRLKTLNGTIGIKSITVRAMPYVGKVYNLKVKNSEQYAVGKDGLIVRDW